MLLAAFVASGCATPAQRFARHAEAARLEPLAIYGSGFEHRLYRNEIRASSQNVLFVFLDGDGTPWINNGTRPARDPTPRNPLALELMQHTPFPALYLTRPCYNGLQATAGCDLSLWTDGRYSAAVVASLGAAIDHYVSGLPEPSPRIVLVGYSGGGTLVALLAHRTGAAPIAAIVTVAANLDIERWTTLHGYLPLTDSMNPATHANAEHAASTDSMPPELHLSGALDTNVPPDITMRYFAAHPHARRWVLPEFGHVCCWVEQWPTLLPEILARVGLPAIR